MQPLRQQMFGRGRCAFCAVARPFCALFAGFLFLALTFATTLILSSTMFITPAFADVNSSNAGIAASSDNAPNNKDAN